MTLPLTDNKLTKRSLNICQSYSSLLCKHVP